MKRDWHHLYKTSAWLGRRAAQLRDEPLCVMCKADGRLTVATVADHVVPHKGDRGLFFGGALQSLCATHHSSTKAREEQRGVAIGCDATGRPTGAGHYWNTGAGRISGA